MIGNFLASYDWTLMSEITGDNSSCRWCWTLLFPIVELQCIRLWILLIIFDVFELQFIHFWRLMSYPVFYTRLPVRLKYVWIYTHILCNFCWLMYSIFIMNLVIIPYLHLFIIICTHWSRVWIIRYTWTHWRTIYIGQQFLNVNMIMRQEIGQWGRWTKYNFTNKNIHHYDWCQLF